MWGSRVAGSDCIMFVGCAEQSSGAGKTKEDVRGKRLLRSWRRWMCEDCVKSIGWSWKGGSTFFCSKVNISKDRWTWRGKWREDQFGVHI